MTKIDEVLLRAKEGGMRIPEIARNLLRTEGLIRVFDPADMAKYLENSPNALQQDQPEPPSPVPLDLSFEGKPVACAFSHMDHAHHFAAGQDMLSNGLAITRRGSWSSGLGEILHGAYDGMILDYEAPHWLGFNPDQVRKLYAHVRWDVLMASPELYLLSQGTGPLVLRHEQGAQASGAVDPRAAGAMHRIFATRDPRLEVRPIPFSHALQQLSSAGVTQLVINNELPDWHVYGQQELAWMQQGRAPG